MFPGLSCLRDTGLEATNIALSLPPVDLVPREGYVGGRTNRGVRKGSFGRFRCHLLYLLSRLLKRSRARSDQREVCSLSRGVMFDGSATPIRPVTGRLSLSPSSFADHTIRPSYEFPSCDQ